jgi:hypothetical protein
MPLAAAAEHEIHSCDRFTLSTPPDAIIIENGQQRRGQWHTWRSLELDLDAASWSQFLHT